MNTRHYILIGLSIVLLLSTHEANGWIDLNQNEREIIRRLVNEIPPEKGVGQLLVVGVPSDIGGYSTADDARVFEEMGIGGAFLNTYNISYYGSNPPPNEEILNEIESLTARLQILSRRSSLHAPLFTMVDFEGPKFSSLPNAIIPPPPALTLATSQDGELIRLTGQVVASQLRTLGVHAIAGPVLDVDHTEQGALNIAIQNRAFASSPGRVFNIASHYITGAREAGLVLFAKHFPGLGAAVGDPHGKDMPVYRGTRSKLQSDLRPYVPLATTIEGIMTSHLRLTHTGSSRPVTFSPSVIQNVIRGGSDEDTIKTLNYKDQVIITDDLSSMGAVINYMEREGKSYADIAVEAFNAGHDLLLFSHLEVSESQRRGKHGNFTIDELTAVRKALIEFIERTPAAGERYREALFRILAARCRRPFLAGRVLGGHGLSAGGRLLGS